MSISLTEEAELFLEKKSASHLLFDVEMIIEPCLQVYNPIVRILKKSEMLTLPNINKIIKNKYEFLITDKFFKIFNTPSELLINLQGLIKKKLKVSNIEPIIKNTCRINY